MWSDTVPTVADTCRTSTTRPASTVARVPRVPLPTAGPRVASISISISQTESQVPGAVKLVSQCQPSPELREGKTVKGGVVCTDPAEWERETKLTWGCKEMQDASNGTSLSQSRAERDQPRDCHSLSQSSSVSTSRSLRPSWSGTCASISS